MLVLLSQEAPFSLPTSRSRPHMSPADSPSRHFFPGEAQDLLPSTPLGAKLFPFLPQRTLVPGLLPIVHHQASDCCTVVRELFVAGHAVDIDDVDDGVFGAHPHLAVLCHHHTVLKGAKTEGWGEPCRPGS